MVNFVNEVPNTALTDNVLKYTLTKEDNTTELVQIDLATPLQVVGTPLNKATFDSIKTHLDLIGKYNTPTISSSASVTSGSYIPTYTSATNPTGFEVTASSSYQSSNYPWVALDGDTTTYWQKNTSDGNSYWQIRLDSAILVKEIQITSTNSSTSNSSYIGIQASNDGVNFGVVGVATISTGTRVTATTQLTTTKRYKYWRAYPSTQTGEHASADLSNRIYEFKITKWYSNSSYNKYILSNNITSLDKGQVAKILVPSAYAGGSIQLNINNLGYKNVVVPDDYVVEANKPISLWYDGTNFVPEF